VVECLWVFDHVGFFFALRGAISEEYGVPTMSILQVRLQPAALTSWARRAAKQPLRVLVVDDNVDAADSLARLIKMWGHEVDVAYSGPAAVALTAAYQPDVMLLDIAMPMMDGHELARRLRRQTRFEHTLLIAVTGYVDEDHRLLGEEAGFDHHLSKPTSPQALKRMLLLLQQGRGDSPRAEVRAGLLEASAVV
jgi:CheY-like chemotaxis protein